MLEKIFRVHPEVCKYSHLSYSQRSFPFNGHSVINFLKRTQEGDPALLYDYFQDLIYSLESKIILWYLFDENYFDNKSLFERSQKIFEAEKSLRLNLNPRNAIFFIVTSLKKTIDTCSIFPKILPLDQNTNETSDDYRTVLKDLKKSWRGKNAGTQSWTDKRWNFYTWWHYWTTMIDNFSNVPTVLTWDQNTIERWTYYSEFTARFKISGWQIRKKIKELEKGIGIVENFDAL